MGIAAWGAVVGALLGFVLADFSQFGFIFGGALGAGMGAWLRSAIRQEIGDAVRSALSGGLSAVPSAQVAPSPPVAARTQPEPARVVTAPIGDPRKIEESPAPAAGPAPLRTPPPRPLEPAPPGPASVFLSKARDWLLGGNTIVRVGIVILFLGLVFLVRFAAVAGLFPIEARLALGSSFHRAIMGLMRESIRRALLPTINQMSAAGVITLPGIMTGQILAGMDPMEAAKYQIVLMFLLAGGSGLAAVAVVYLAMMRLTDERQRLRLDRLTAQGKGATR